MVDNTNVLIEEREGERIKFSRKKKRRRTYTSIENDLMMFRKSLAKKYLLANDNLNDR